MECCQTKIKVITTNQAKVKCLSEPKKFKVKSINFAKVQENTSDQVVVGFSFASE